MTDMSPAPRSSPSQNYRGSLFRRHPLDNGEVVSLLDGILQVPHREGYIRNASVEETKAALRQAGLSDSHVPIPFTVTAVKIAGRLLLIDAGTGGFSIYGTRCGWLAKSMAAAGLDPGSVDAVLVTHLHGDHIYGLMHEGTNEQVFPHAEIIVPADELAWWTRPEVDGMDLGPTRVGLAARIRSTVACWKNVRTVAWQSEVLPGVWAVPTPGHSPGHTAYLFRSGDTQLLATADVSLLPELYYCFAAPCLEAASAHHQGCPCHMIFSFVALIHAI